ncbi:hypothetical protein MLD38_036229 [Melastoma candidum]|uniref:Uncharacterized protein n=1 Tax=Melastoma candidum TaxID=119954 RepID=A0ACB9LJA8_9MYRT|nr:hypothetical protein MLD38_036229 [Melastoma candidum]
MRVRLVSTVVRVRRTLKEFWDSVCGVASKGTQPLIDRDSVAQADTPTFYKYSGNSSNDCQHDGNLKSSLAVGGLLSCSDDGVIRLENIIGGDKSCGDDNGQHNPRLGISKTDTQAVEKCSADVSEAEAKLEVVKAKRATKTSLLSDMMSKYHGNENKISSACGESTLLALVETIADNKNEQLEKEALGEREKANWKPFSGLNVKLLSLKHDIVRQKALSKKNDSTLESEIENVTHLQEKINRCSGASIEKPVSSLTGSCHPSPIGSGTNISMSLSKKKLVARQSENCVNRDNLVFDKALQKRPSTSGDVGQEALAGLIDCIRHIQPDRARDNSKVPGISLNNLAREKGFGKPMKSFCESRSYNVSQTLGATLMKTNGGSNREIRPQVVVNLAAHSMTSESGKDNRPGHGGNIQYSSITSSGQYQKKYPHGLIIRFWRKDKDTSSIITALAKHGPTSLRSLFRGEKFEDFFVQLTVSLFGCLAFFEVLI